jgi:superfamily II DNA or RNA helicase
MENALKTEKCLFKTYRYYQKEADDAIYQELLTSNKCLVKMFCGTGKSLIMRNCKINKSKNLIVYVFPSLNLINQFYDDYLSDIKDDVLKVSSDDGSTTDIATIIAHLQNKRIKNKIICITYQSFELLLNNLGDLKIDVCYYDEAHHAVGQKYQTFIFGNTSSCLKQIFFTATPKNANGIIMYDRDNIDQNMCGKLVYDYSYLRGVNEGYLNPFEIRIDMYTDNTNKSVYECIARAIIASGNSRCLTFHSDVNTDRNTSVRKFVDETEFVRVFVNVLKKEFSDRAKYYKKVKMFALDASILPSERKSILKQFDNTPNNEVIVISSCETIGEGIDTKNANMCVFVDPKSSFVKITQNIGRIVRKIFGQDKPNSTILIPCWIDKTKYLECDGDKEKCDEIIRQDMAEGGNCNSILNVMSALKQEHEDLYDICLHYPDCFSPQEIENNLVRQGFTILDEDMDLNEGLEYFELELDEDHEEFNTNEELLMKVANDNDVCIEVYTNSLEEPVERYNTECESGEIVRMYKDEREDGEDIYRPIVKKESGEKKTKDIVEAPDKIKRLNVKVHTNPDVKVLWNVVGELDLTKDICSCIIDCEVVKYDPMEVAEGIVQRAKQREENGENLLPKKCCQDKKKEHLAEELQEHKDAGKLGHWKDALKEKGKSKCPTKVKEYLDLYLKGWNEQQDLEEIALQNVKEIVLRSKKRKLEGKNLLPKQLLDKRKIKEYSEEEIREHKDAARLQNLKNGLKGAGTTTCHDKVKKYLDLNLDGWNDDLEAISLKNAKDVVFRAKKREVEGKNLLPKGKCKNKNQNYTEKEDQEYKDAKKLGHWKQALKGQGNSKCPNSVKGYLDLYLKGWNDEQDLEGKSLQNAKDIVFRAKKRENEGLNLFPRKNSSNKNQSEERQQEDKDSRKLDYWIQSLKGKGQGGKCYDEVRDYLDTNLPNWRKKHQNTTIIEEHDEEYVFEKKPIKSTKIHRQSLVPNKTETCEQKKHRTKNELSTYHQKYITMRSDTLASHFKGNPEEFTNYHTCRDENLETFQEKPHEIACKFLESFKTKRQKTVVDMGCGLAKIANHFAGDKRFKFINYDHVSVAQNIEVCDISSMPLDDDTVDICIMCFALWGSNCADYVKQAYRVLETQGSLYLIDSTKRWSDKNTDGYIEEGMEGSRLKILLENTGFKIVNQKIEKFCLFHCVKI